MSQFFLRFLKTEATKINLTWRSGYWKFEKINFWQALSLWHSFFGCTILHKHTLTKRHII